MAWTSRSYCDGSSSRGTGCWPKTARGRSCASANTTLRPRLFQAASPASAATRPMPWGWVLRTPSSAAASTSATPPAPGWRSQERTEKRKHALGRDRREAGAARPGRSAARDRSRERHDGVVGVLRLGLRRRRRAGIAPGGARCGARAGSRPRCGGQIVTVGVPCWTAMWVSPVSTPTTARHEPRTSTASPGVGATHPFDPVARSRRVRSARRDLPHLVARRRSSRSASLGPPSRRPRLVGPVGLGDEQHAARPARVAADARSGTGAEKSARMPKSAQIRSRMSLMSSGPKAASNSAEPHQ